MPEQEKIWLPTGFRDRGWAQEGTFHPSPYEIEAKIQPTARPNADLLFEEELIPGEIEKTVSHTEVSTRQVYFYYENGEVKGVTYIVDDKGSRVRMKVPVVVEGEAPDSSLRRREERVFDVTGQTVEATIRNNLPIAPSTELYPSPEFIKTKVARYIAVQYDSDTVLLYEVAFDHCVIVGSPEEQLYDTEFEIVGIVAQGGLPPQGAIEQGLHVIVDNTERLLLVQGIRPRLGKPLSKKGWMLRFMIAHGLLPLPQGWGLINQRNKA